MSLALADWRNGAACRNTPGLFFGPDREGDPAREMREQSARMVCAACPVTGPCLDWALRTGDRWSVSGGLTPEQRTSLKQSSARIRHAERNRAAIEAAGEKVCTQCGGEPKPLDDFGREGESWRGNCKRCRNAGERQRRREAAS